MIRRLNAIASAYNMQAEFEYYICNNGYLKPRYELIKNIISKRINKKLQIIDVGGGSGILSIWLAKNNHTVILVDISERCIEYARYLAKKNNCYENIQFEVLAAEQLGETNFISKSELVLCLGVTHHADSLYTVNSIIYSLKKKMKSDGYLLISFINGSVLSQRLFLNNTNNTIENAIFVTNGLYENGEFSLFDPERGLHTWVCTPKKAIKILNSNGLQVIEKFGFDAIVEGINWEKVKNTSLDLYNKSKLKLEATYNDPQFFKNSSLMYFLCQRTEDKI